MKKKRWMLCLFAAACLFAPGTSYASLSGNGSRENPLRGSTEAAAGDHAAPGAWFQMLTAQHDRTLRFQAVYEAGAYEVKFSAEGGTIPGAGESETRLLRYNDGSGATSETVALPKEPSRSGYAFLGWYLKGNNSADGTLLKNGSRYMIAAENAADAKMALMEGGKPVVRALWKKLSADQPDDGNGPDIRISEKTPDPWNSAHSRNHVLEYRDEAPVRAQYRMRYGQTAHQYGRILFDAETNAAAAYRWYVNGKQQTETGPQLLLSGIRRELDRARVQCTVVLDDGKTELQYSTEIRVHYLPEIQDTVFYCRET